MTTMGLQMSDEKIIDKLKGLFVSVDTVELMVHPGYPSKGSKGGCDSKSGPDGFSCSNDRLHELKQLQSQAIKNYFYQNDIKLISFLDLKNIS